MSVARKRDLLAAFEKLEANDPHGAKISEAVDNIRKRYPHQSPSSNSSTPRLKTKKRQGMRHRHSVNITADPSTYLPSTILLSPTKQ